MKFMIPAFLSALLLGFAAIYAVNNLFLVKPGVSFDIGCSVFLGVFFGIISIVIGVKEKD